MASYYKRGDYQWEAKVRRKGFPTLSKSFETKQEAETWALQVEAEMKRGTFVSRAEADHTRRGAVVAEARRQADRREQDCRARALKICPWTGG